MKKIHLLFSLLLWTFAVQVAFAQTRTGLHMTAEELVIIKARTPLFTGADKYYNWGDVQTNSPADWSRIAQNASYFLTHTTEDRWRPAFTGCVGTSTALATPQTNHIRLEDAAFYYYVSGNSTYAAAVRSELLAQAAEATTNWNNSAIWCPGGSGDSGPAFSIAEWFTRLLYAYDYIKDYSSLTGGDKLILNAWFKAGATYVASNYEIELNDKFVDRANGNYTLAKSGLRDEVKGSKNLVYYGGPYAHHMAKVYNNRKCVLARYVGEAGIFLSDAGLQKSGKQFFREWLDYGILQRTVSGQICNFVADEHRGVDFIEGGKSFAEKGDAYAHSATAAMISLADAFARIGDTSLYDYTTLGGTTTATTPASDMTSVPTGGTAKSLLKVIKTLCWLRNGFVSIYATSVAANNGNVLYLVNGRNPAPGVVWNSNHDIVFAQADLYYADSYIHNTFMRTASGSVAYARPQATFGPSDGHRGLDYPAVMLLYGNTGVATILPTPAKTDQGIVFTEIPNHTYGDAPFSLNAVATSNLPVVYTVASGPATKSGSTLTITGAGQVVVNANQAGNGSFNPAPLAQQTFRVLKAEQTISFTAIDDKINTSSPFSLSATASSGLSVRFNVLSGPATISGSSVTLTGQTEQVIIGAYQDGNANFLPASTTRSFLVFATAPPTVGDGTASGGVTSFSYIQRNATTQQKETVYVFDCALTTPLNTISKFAITSGDGEPANALKAVTLQLYNGSTLVSTVLLDASGKLVFEQPLSFSGTFTRYRILSVGTSLPANVDKDVSGNYKIQLIGALP